jgi:hypothetical protein
MGRAVGLVAVLCCCFSFLPFERAYLPSDPGTRASAAVPPDSIRTDFSDYIWPTDAGTIITSTFAEFRTMHFHGGIDVSTGDRTGYRVFASRDGYVSHIHIGATGYGKMLFVRHRDGYTTTYAHLSRFAPALNTRAAQEQRRLECYPIDIDLGPDEFPVRKGEVIAYTGDTGIGSPHLHFEIRDENLEAVNPQLADHIRIPDGIAPNISKVAIAPLGENTRVHGGWETQVYRAFPEGSNRYRISDVVNITGRAGFAVSVRDRTEGSRFQRGVYRNSLYIDDQLVYSASLQHAPMKNAHQIGLYYDWDLLDRGQGRFEKLYAEGSGPHPFRPAGAADAGVVRSTDYPEGRHRFRIVCEDIAGNRSEVSGALVFNHPPEFQMEAAGPDLALRFPDLASVDKILVSTAKEGTTGWATHTMVPERINDGNQVRVPLPPGTYDVVRIVAQNVWGTKSIPQFFFVRKPSSIGQSFKIEHSVESGFVRVVAKTSGMFTAPPVMTVYEGQERRAVPLNPTDIDTYVGSFKPSETFAGLRRISADAEVNGRRTSAFEEFSLYPIVPGKSGTFQLDNGRLVLSYDSLTAYSTVYMEIAKEVEDGETTYSLLPLRTVLGGNLRVAVAGDPGVQHEGLYFRGRSSKSLVTAQHSGSDNTFRGTISRTLGDLYLAVDDSPPSVSRLHVSASGGRPRVEFRFSDYGSGIEYDDLKMYIDGNVAIPEIDGEHRRVQYQASDPLERGSHLLTIRLKDRAGNSSSIERRFSVH